MAVYKRPTPQGGATKDDKSGIEDHLGDVLYKIYFKKLVWKDFESIPKKDLTKVLAKIKALAGNPRPPGALKLSGQDRYRLRQGRCRILYSIQGEVLTIWVVKVAHRKNVYR